jgi:hypothetical protein
MKSRGSYSEEEYERIKIGAQLEEELRYAREGSMFFENMERASRSNYRKELLIMTTTELTKKLTAITKKGDVAELPHVALSVHNALLQTPEGEERDKLIDVARLALRQKLCVATDMPIQAESAYMIPVSKLHVEAIGNALIFDWTKEEVLASIQHGQLVCIPSTHEGSDGKSVSVLRTTSSTLQSAAHKHARIAERPTTLSFEYVCTVEPAKKGGGKNTVTLAYSSPKSLDENATKAIKELVSCGYEPFVREGKGSPNLYNRIKLVSRLAFLEKPIDNDLLQDIDEGEDGKEVLARHIDTAFNSPKFDEDGRLENSIFE